MDVGQDDLQRSLPASLGEDTVKSQAKVKLSDTHCSPLIHKSARLVRHDYPCKFAPLQVPQGICYNRAHTVMFQGPKGGQPTRCSQG